ncbi:MAG TPA: RNA polymerase sigma factor [Thermoanaerobaculia bacterium]|nr:RNA polymerase sigma factor [Thermoanaerobaculia bacterium]
MMTPSSRQDELYEETAARHAPALERLARSYELDPDKRKDLLQEIHLALWRSFAGFAAQCSLRTWVYRVAHNVAASHVMRHRRLASRRMVSLDEIADMPSAVDHESVAGQQNALDRIYILIHRLNPPERQVMLLYLEGLDAASIGEVTGISAGNVAIRIHRIKKILAERFRQGGNDGR